MNVTYIYDRNAVKNVDMSKFHAVFEGMLKAFLDSDVREEKDVSAKTVESTTDVADRIEFAKYAVLRKIPMFEQYGEAELKALCTELKLVHVNASTNILMAGDEAENLYFLCTGNFEALGNLLKRVLNSYKETNFIKHLYLLWGYVKVSLKQIFFIFQIFLHHSYLYQKIHAYKPTMTTERMH